MVEFEDFHVGVADTSMPPSENGDEQAFADQLNLLGHYFERKNKPAVFGSRECLTSSVEIVFCVHVYVNVTSSSHLLLYWYLPDYPYYGWGTEDDDITRDGGTKSICQSMVEATSLTDWGQMPPSFDFLLGSHIHLGSITSFENSNDGTRNPPQLVIGNSGTQFVSPSEPPDDIFGLEVRQTEVVYQYGYIVATRKKRGGKSGKSRHALLRDVGGKSDGSWGLEFKVCTC